MKRLAWLLLILYASTSDAKPKTPADAKYKGWWSCPVGADGAFVNLMVNGVVVDSVFVAGLDPRYVGVLFIAPRDPELSGGKHANRAKGKKH